MAGVDRGPDPFGECNHDISSLPSSLPSSCTIVEAGYLVSPDEGLSTEIDKSLLRAVPASVVLRGFGAALRKHEFRQEDYLQSACADRLDDFISHDWASGWFGKSLALCLLYNSRPAAIASLLAGVVVVLLQSGMLRVLPVVQATNQGGAYIVGIWCEAVCPLVFAGVFIFWQDIRAVLRLRTRRLFLDKYCIDQMDEVRKAAGVAGLGGFLKHTDRLVICWTPRYFTRLWCTFEVASWLYLQKPLSKVEFVPLSHAKGIVLGGFFSCVGICLYTLVSTTLPLYKIPLLLVGLALVLPGMMHQLRRLIHDIRQLPAQLQGFRARDSGCSCCEHQHRVSGKEGVIMQCDREIVYRTLRGWFPECAGSEPVYEGGAEADVPEFDAEVREFFGPWVLQKAGPTQIPYGFLVLLGLPVTFRGLDTLVFLGRDFSLRILGKFLLEYTVDALAVWPIIFKSTLHFVAWVDSKVGIPRDRCRDVLVTLVCSLFPLVVLILTWLPMMVAFDTRWPLALPFAGLNLAIAAVLFRHELRRSRLAAWVGCAPRVKAQPKRRSSRSSASLRATRERAHVEMLN